MTQDPNAMSKEQYFKYHFGVEEVREPVKIIKVLLKVGDEPEDVQYQRILLSEEEFQKLDSLKTTAEQHEYLLDYLDEGEVVDFALIEVGE